MIIDSGKFSLFSISGKVNIKILFSLCHGNPVPFLGFFFVSGNFEPYGFMFLNFD